MSSLKENKMGTMPIGRLLLTMALPMALSMLVQALYNVVDSAFVAKISDVNQDALNAVSLAFPVQNIMIGIATGTAVGVNALLSRALGERDADMVNRSALNGVFLAGLGMLLSALFGIFCAELFMRSQTSNEAVIAYGTDRPISASSRSPRNCRVPMRLSGSSKTPLRSHSDTPQHRMKSQKMPLPPVPTMSPICSTPCRHYTTAILALSARQRTVRMRWQRSSVTASTSTRRSSAMPSACLATTA